MRILLVEDDPDLSRQLKAALADAGYAVDHAADGEEAGFLGETEPYDAIVLDLGFMCQRRSSSSQPADRGAKRWPASTPAPTII